MEKCCGSYFAKQLKTPLEDAHACARSFGFMAGRFNHIISLG